MALVVPLSGCAVSHGDESERISALLEACFPRDVVYAFPVENVAGIRGGWGNATIGLVPIDVPEIDCLARAGSSCAAARACVGVVSTAVTACSVTQRCDGETAVVCAPSLLDPPNVYETRYDCGARGLHCFRSDADGSIGCGISACDGAPSRCTSDGHVEWCAGFGGTFVDFCEGTVCEAEIGCAGPACTASTCDGDVASICHVPMGRVIQVLDCAVVGQVCREGICQVAFDECHPWTDRGPCDGSAVEYCALSGRLERYDCRELGFAGCADGRCVAAE